ncbi:serine hydrolase [Lentisphaera marina]|uniref:serine hydrolase domain-containing protein n=1 Tax=Lentisphaera marina TaxID=1111041 RepID=UPI00236717E5|nr:serine hydrolase [Lentisphaera marina]MDD7983576.1 serine hydrolase [Lentisphaera marina]
MKLNKTLLSSVNYLIISVNLLAQSLPTLDQNLDQKNQSSKEQKKISYLSSAYASTRPADLKDGIKVGSWDKTGVDEAVQSFLADDKKGKYQNLDSLLIHKDGKLIFEMYNRRGRVDGPHYTMSITKTMTSVCLARAIQLDLLSINDLDHPIIDFMPGIDSTKIQKGVETITLRNALFMKSGLRFKSKNIMLSLEKKYQKQAYFQKVFEATSPITEASKEYKYSGLDATMIMMIIDIKTNGQVQKWIETEVTNKLGTVYCWNDKTNAIPACGAGSNFTSRTLIKVANSILNGGQLNGQQWLSPEYVKLIMDSNKGEGYFYYFHNRRKFTKGDKVNFISGIGAGGQYMSIYPNHNMIIVATSHNKKAIDAPLKAIGDHFIKLLEK